ncbi:MAG: hypothetical protein ABI183_06440, partial [Polyangiaceae bacterium]
EHTGDRAGAAADLKKLHDLSPSDQAVLEELAALLRDLGDYRGMVQLYEDQILRGKDMQARAELARKVAQMWEEQIQDPREAADAWRRVLRMRPADDEATQGLERAKTNMLKKPDPNAGPDAYAPPKPTPSLPPPEPVKVEPKAAPLAAKSSRTLEAPKPSSPAIRGAASSPRDSAKDLPPTVEVKSASKLAELFGDVEDSEEDDALAALEVKAEVRSEVKAPLDESTAPHALSVELIATIRGAGGASPKTSEKAAEKPASILAEKPTARADEKKRVPMKPLPARSPSMPPADLDKTSASPYHAIDEELHTAPGGVPVFRGGALPSAIPEARTISLEDLDIRKDTDENATTASDDSDDEPEPTIMGKSFDFSDDTQIHHADIPIDAGSEPMLVDDIAELVDEDEPDEPPPPKPRTNPPPLPRS